MGTIDFRGAVMLALMALPFVGIGYVLGMLHMRSNYLGLLKKAQVENTRQQRWARANAEHQRHIGFAVGYREGRRTNEGNA